MIWKKALALAQKNVEASQRYQADLYNKTTYGYSINVDYQVLLANKGERRHKKLADKSESTPYSCFSESSMSHLPYTQNTHTGQEKTVQIAPSRLFLPIEFEQIQYLQWISL